MKRSKKVSVFVKILSLFIIFVLVPATLIFGSRLRGNWFYLTSTLLVLELMLPFFLSFESRRVQARELVTLAVLAAIAAVSRVAFAFIPHFSPITGIIMIAGIAFGAEAGFLTGAVAAFASNLYFGQGLHTPWQMMAYGFGGFLAGLLFYRRKKLQKPWLMAIFGYLAIQFIVGPLLDCSSIFLATNFPTWEVALAYFASGFPVNAVHGTGAALTLLLVGRPMLGKLERLRVKYGMTEGADGL